MVSFTQVSAQPIAGRIHQIDILRGIAALAVVFAHWHFYATKLYAAEFTALAKGFWLANEAIQLFCPQGWSHAAVLLFICLSGYCIHAPQAGGSRPLEMRRFTIRRFFRIYPVFACALALGLLTHAVCTSAANPWYAPAATPRASLAAALGGLPAFLPIEQPAGNPVLSTVISEMGLYLLYPPLLWFARRFGWPLLLALTALVSVSAVLFATRHTGYLLTWPRFSAYGFLLCWWIGAYAAELRARPARGKPLPPIFWLLLTVLYVTINRFVKHEYAWVLLGPLASVLCGAMLLNIEGLFRVPNPLTAALDWIGTRSYSLYVVHWPALVFSFATLAHVEAPVIWLRLSLPILLGAVLMLILYHLIEVPSHELGKKLAPKA